jgi:hypothetical protein
MESADMDDTPGPDPSRDNDGRFGSGNPGRPPGARNKMSRRIALSLLRHFTENEAEILHRLSHAYLRDYMRLIGRMLPDDPEAEAEEPEAQATPAAPAPGDPTVIYGENTVSALAEAGLKNRNA